MVNANDVNTLVLNTGSATTVNSGLLEATGSGGLILNSVVNNGTSGKITAAGGNVYLQGGTIQGGTLTTTGGGNIVENGSGTLDGSTNAVANTGTVAVADNTTLRLLGTITNTGTVSLNSGGNTTVASIGPSTGSGTVTLAGGGQVVLGNGGQNIIEGGTATDVLSNINNTISGSGQIGAGTLTFVNGTAGVVNANVSNALTLNTGASAATNSGLLALNPPAAAGCISTPWSATAQPARSPRPGGNVFLQGGTIQGGTISTTGTANFIENSGRSGSLDGSANTVTNTGTIAVADNTSLGLLGTITNTGTIALNSAGNTTVALIGPSTGTGTVALTGSGQIVLGNTAQNVVEGSNATDVLNNINNTISGGGQIGAGTLTFINGTAGVVNANDATSLTLNTGAVATTNNGLLEATAGSGGLVIASTVNNGTAGKISAAGGNVFLQGGTIQGGTISTTGGAAFFENSSGTLDGTAHTVTTSGTTVVDNNTTLTLLGTLTNKGTLTLASTGNATALSIGPSGTAGTVTLTGSGLVNLGDNNQNYIFGTIAGDTLVNLNNTISGAGTFASPLTLINDGTINANAVNNALVLNNGSVVTNNSVLEDTVAGNGGLVINTVVNNGTLGSIVAATGNVYLQNGTIQGGTIKSSGGGGLYETATGTLDGSAHAVTNLGNVTVDNNEILNLVGSIVNNGTIALASTGNGTWLEIDSATVSLTGTGAIALSNNNNNYIFGAVGTNVLNNVHNVISGAGQIGGVGSITLINGAAGVIDANLSAGLTLNVGTVAIANSGLIEATAAGVLSVNSTTINDTTGGTLLAGGANVYLNSATIIGGVVSSTGSAAVIANTGTNLFNGATQTVTIKGEVIVANNEQLNITGTITNTGTINLQSAGNGTVLEVTSASLTLNGGGQILLSDNNNNYIYAAAGTDILNNVNNTIEGSGNLGDAQLTLINGLAGTISATGTGSALVINTAGVAVSNSGLIESVNTGGLLLQNTSIVNGTLGLIEAAGGNVYLQSATISGGTLSSTGTGSFIDQTNATLDGSVTTVTNDTTVTIANNEVLTVLGTITNVGTISLASGGNGTDLEIGSNSVVGTTVLTGGGSVVLSDNPNNVIGATSANNTLDNINNVISGGGRIGDNSLVVVNATAGVINANATNALTINTGTSTTTNSGVLEATSSGGLVLQSAIANAAGRILAAGGNVYLDGTTITGGTFTSSAGGAFYQEDNAGFNGSTLDGTANAVVLNATLNIDNNCGLGLLGTITNQGTISVNSAGNGTGIEIGTTTGTVATTVTLNGGGQILLSDNVNNYILGGIAGDTLINVNNTFSGAGQLNSNLVLVNQSAGVFDASGASSFVFNTGSNVISNYGLLESTNTGGLVLQTVIDNFSAGTISAAGGNVFLDGTTIEGGTLKASAGGTFYQEDPAGYNGSTLDGTSNTVTLIGPLVVDNNTGLGLLGTISNQGSILVNSAGNGTGIEVGVTTGTTASTVTLTGTGTITLSDNVNNQILGGITGDVLYNKSNTINGAGSFNGNLVLLNGGIVEATNSDNALIIASATGTNLAGGQLLAANGATLLIENGTLTNLGLIQADDSSAVTFQSNETLTNSVNGTLTGGGYGASSTGDGATLSITGAAVSVDAGTIILSGAGSVIDFGGTSIDASLQTIAAGGTLSLSNGRNFTQTANGGTLADSGLLSLGGTSFTAAALTIGATGTLSGYGTVAGPVSDAGLINASGGTLVFTSAVSGAGTLAASAGATVDLTVAGALTETISGAGTLQLDGGTYTLANKTVSIGTVKVDSGSALTGSGTLTGTLIDSGTVNATGGTLTIDGAVNSGSFSAASGATLDLAGGGTFTGLVSGAGTLEIASHAFTLTSSASLTVANVLETANITLASDAFSNGAGKHFTITAAAGQTVVLGASGSGSSFSNAGTLLANGPGMADINTVFTDTGTASVTAGTLLLGKALSGNGTLSAGAGAVLGISGGGTFSGALTGAGTLSIGSFALTLASGASVSAANVVQTVNVTLASDAITNAAGDTYRINAASGAKVFVSKTGAGSTFTNAGTLIAGGPGTADMAVGFTNTGTTSVTAGTLLLGGTLAGTGTLSAGTGALLSISGGGTFAGALTGAGTLSIGSYNLTLAAGASLSAANVMQTSSVVLASDSITNASGNTYAINAASGTTVSITKTGTGSSFTNAGTFVVNGAGRANLATAFTDNGTASVTAGTLLLAGTLAGNGTLSAGAGALLQIAGGGSFAGALAGAGTLTISSFNLTLSAGASLSAGHVVQTAGLVLASDAITNAAGNTYAITAASGIKVSIVRSGTGSSFTNAGTLIANGTGTADIAVGFTDTGIASVTAGTLLLASTLTGNGTLSAGTGALLSVSGGGTFSGALTGAGTLSIGSYNLTLAAGASLSAGHVMQTASLVLASDSITNAAGNTYAINAASGTTVSITKTGTGSSFTNAGTFVVNGAGKANIAAAFTDNGAASVTAGTLLLSGSLAGNGTLSAGAGALLQIAGGGSFAGALAGAGTLTISSFNLTLSAGASLSAGHVVQTAGLVLASDAITNAAGNTYTTTAASGINVAITGSGTGSSFTNAGTFAAGGAGTDTVNVAFINSGTVNANAGTLSFLGAVTNNGTIDAATGLTSVKTTVSGTGTLDVGATGTLSLLLGAGSGQVVDFAASTGLLDLTKPLDFTGTITGFGGADQIDLLNTAETTYNYTNNVLSVKNGSATVASLHFTGISNSFSLTSDGHSGTLIKFG